MIYVIFWYLCGTIACTARGYQFGYIKTQTSVISDFGYVLLGPIMMPSMIAGALALYAAKHS